MLAALAAGVPTVLSDQGANAELLRGVAAGGGNGACEAALGSGEGTSGDTRLAFALSAHKDAEGETTPAVVAKLWVEEAVDHLEVRLHFFPFVAQWRC